MVNISDVYSNKKWSTDRGWLEICNPMNDYLSKLGTYQGCIGMEMACLIVVEEEDSKTYEGSVWTEKSLENKEDKKFGEPIWVWKKITDYFKKFYNMEPYLFIDEKEWKYILDTYEKDDVIEEDQKIYIHIHVLYLR